jgi:hypothetical protein
MVHEESREQLVLTNLALKGLDLPPFLDDGEFFLGEVNGHFDEVRSVSPQVPKGIKSCAELREYETKRLWWSLKEERGDLQLLDTRLPLYGV